MVADNKSLGKFILDGIVPAPRGAPQIEVEFDLNTDGILNVTAKRQKRQAKEQSIHIEAGSGLSDEEIEKMKQDAEAHAQEDVKKKKISQRPRNIVEQAIYEGEVMEKQEGISDEAKKRDRGKHSPKLPH